MPIIPTYPGVYIEELPSAARAITGVSTSVTAFIGSTLKGPANKAMLIHSFPEYERTFGKIWKGSNLGYAVYHYFLNGGKDAIIIRVYKDASEAIYERDDKTLKFKAANPGSWGKTFDIFIDGDVDQEKFKTDSTLFNILVKDKTTGAILETFLNLSAVKGSSRYAPNVLEQQSTLIRIDGDIPPNRPPIDDLKDPSTFKVTDDSGDDDKSITANEIMGTSDDKSGLYALDDVDIFNMLCIPTFGDDTEEYATERATAYGKALEYCTSRRAMLIVDPLKEWNYNYMISKGAKSFAEEVTKLVSRDKNAAFFFPRIIASDPNEEFRLRDFDPCGAVAGVIARTDSERGVWKAPAGIEATLTGVPDLAVRLTNEENGGLNSLGINCLRIMPDVGRVVWGARTMRGADILADQWKYLPVRRMALYIEESLYRGTQWVVFEPNDEKLWSQIRLNIGAFMQNLFTQGAFQGTDPKKAYFVKCDQETTTQYDIDRGIVNIVVGFAPLKPAEFVIIKIQQITGQEKT
jgi:uncharacterized protein